MAEIKSTLELAMERTKKMTISREEKEEIKRKEILEKATGLFHQYREGHLPLHEILKEMERLEGEKKTRVKEILLSQWIDALSLNDETDRLLKGVESLKTRSIDEVKQKLHHLLSQYRREKEEVQHKVKVQWVEALRKTGIDGSAVEPNIEGSEFWKKELAKLDHLYGIKMEEIREQLKML